MKIFLDERDYQHFLNFAAQVLEDARIRCLNYCLMPNHYHLTLQPEGSNLSEAIQCLNGGYAGWWNKRHGRVGHVFQGRFKDQIVDHHSYLLTLNRYVVLNPVRAGLVATPELWPWSSYRATVGLADPAKFLAVDAVLSMFGASGRRQSQERFAEFVGVSSDEASAVTDLIRSNQAVLGDDAFRAYVRTFASRPFVRTSPLAETA